MRYEEARSHILDGDLIAVKETHGILPTATRFFTKSEYTHVGIAVWLDGGLWMAELNGGRNHLIPLSQLEQIDFDVFEPPSISRANIRMAVLESLRVRTEYGFIALPVIGLLNWLKVRVFLHARRILVCSGYCVMVYEMAGWDEHTRILSPKELCDYLVQKLSVSNEFKG